VARWSIQGRWVGEYSYDPITEYPQDFPAVPFILDIDEEAVGKFRGQAQDDLGKGPPEPASVQGQTVGNTVEFTKQMPVFYMDNGGELQTFEEWVRQEHNLELDYPVRPPLVVYEGTFSFDGEGIEGRWMLGEPRVHFRSAGIHRFLDMSSNSGTWHARRCRPLTIDSSWLTSTVKRLADSIYERKAFERLPILGDALEDAGCNNADILHHCRQQGDHVGGCWVVDLLLGKE
jgi:hypothetical protein